MKVMKLTTPKGIFYNEDYSPQLIAQTLQRAPDWEKIEMVEMSEEHYNGLPTSNEAAELWRE